MKEFLQRFLRHAHLAPHTARRRFGAATAHAIEEAITASEHRHRGELRFVAEGRLSLPQLWRGIDTRTRAAQLFATLGMSATAERSGILIYVLLAERRVEILADVGITTRVPQAAWDGICRGMETAFRADNYREGALTAIAACSQLLAEHFPANPDLPADNPNELPNAPVLL